MPNRHDLEIILQTRTPIVVIESHEEDRLRDILKAIATRLALPLFWWTVTDGLGRVDLDLAPQKHNAAPDKVLAHIKSARQRGIYVLADFHPFLNDPVHVRFLKDIATDFDQVESIIVLLSHEVSLPTELAPFSACFELELPDDRELRRIINAVASQWQAQNPGRKIGADARAVEALVRNLSGLTAVDASRLARTAIYDDGAITGGDVPAAIAAKHRLLDRNNVLSFEFDTARFADVGGFTRLKQWLEQRKRAFRDARAGAGIDPARGILLLGIQGCGKSLAAKAVAGVFGVPLMRLDFGVLYNKYYGETEKNMREVLRTAERMAPCVLWMDEIEKGLAPQDTDSGPARRVLATLLTWMAERSARVFLVATANDIASLPPELVRKGRFDEIFFVDLPATEARAAILAIHLRKRELDPATFDLEALAAASEGFSGAELEQVVVAAVYAAGADERPPQTRHLLAALEETRPLSRVMAEPVAALRAWARGRTVSAD